MSLIYGFLQKYYSSFPFSILNHIYQWFSTWGVGEEQGERVMILPSRGHLATSGDFLGCHNLGDGSYWYRGQGCCQASFNVQDSPQSAGRPPQQGVIRPQNINSSGVEKVCYTLTSVTICFCPQSFSTSAYTTLYPNTRFSGGHVTVYNIVCPLRPPRAHGVIWRIIHKPE